MFALYANLTEQTWRTQRVVLTQKSDLVNCVSVQETLVFNLMT